MEKHQVKKRIEIALETLRVNDNYLLKNDVNERSIAHRLAVYLEHRFGKRYDVDCEYNKNCENDIDRKAIDVLYRQLEEFLPDGSRLRENDDTTSSIHRAVYPDIIIHKRGRNSKTF